MKIFNRHILFFISLLLLFLLIHPPLVQAQEESTAPKSKKPLPILDPMNPKSILYLNREGKPAGTGDPRKPVGEAYKWGSGWQPAAFEWEGLPKDKYGLVDWIKLAEEGYILPKGSLDPNDPDFLSPVKFKYDPEDEDAIPDTLKPTKSERTADVIFPHTLHQWWLDCNSCHPPRTDPSEPIMPAFLNMTMKEMKDGKYCGKCHGKVAFPLSDCKRCHNTPKAKAKKMCQEEVEGLVCPDEYMEEEE